MPEVPDPAVGSAERWRAVRALLNHDRHRLTGVAARLYPGVPRVGASGLLCREDWIPAVPLDVADVALGWQPEAPAPVVTGTGPVSGHVRPTAADGTRYPSYAAAVADLDRPALFEDRACYRLLAGRLAGPPALDFARTSYFDAVSLGQGVAHELAAAAQHNPGDISLAGLPLRAATGDPCALERRAAICAVTTLTLRRPPGGQASFLLHWRDPARVNHAGGMYQVMPAGIFQPVAGTPASWLGDLSLWHCMVREFSEELLGTSEDYAVSDGCLDYGRWPFFRALSEARAAGTLTVWCAGMGIDPLTLAADVLTVAVFDSDLFDSVFAGLVAVNAEGRVVTEGGSPGIPFTAATVERLTGGSEPMQPAGAALLQLAWRHRRLLLG